jgi:murein DD-endopeptidase MepM/ murein hydrolase activator NlpD
VVPRRVLVLVLLALVFAASAAADLGSQKASIDAKIGRLQGKIASAHAREAALSEEIASVTSQIQTLERRVGDVSSKLAVLQSDLALHQRRLDRLNALYTLQTDRYELLRREYHVTMQRLEIRLVAIYERGQPTAAEAIFDARSVSDLLDQLTYIRSVAKQDRHIATSVKAAKARVRAQRAATAKVRTHVQGEMRSVQVREQQVALVRDELLASRHKLSGARAQKLHDLQATRDSEQEFVSEVDALSAASAALTAKIQAAQSSSTAYSASPSSSGLVWPVSGPVTSPFGMRWGRMHEGIDIGVPYGTAIHAAAAGRVIYCGWESGYGNLTVIDHGNGIATAYGHQSSIAVSCGQDVTQGQVIGYVGCTGHCTGPHLHFEVRVNGAPVDPLGYL